MEEEGIGCIFFFAGVMLAGLLMCAVLALSGFNHKDSWWETSIVAHHDGYFDPKDNSFHWNGEK